MSKTTNELLADIKSRGLVPSGQTTISDQTILNWAEEEMQLWVVPLILKYHQDHLVSDYVIPVSAAASRYDLPERAVGSKILDAKIWYNSDIINIPMVNREDRDLYQNEQLEWAYYLQGTELVFINAPKYSADLHIDYSRRPSSLVLESNSRKVTAVNGQTVTINALADFLVVGTLLDITSNRFNEIVAMDATLLSQNTAAKTLTFGSAIDLSRVRVGDWITLAGKSAIVQLPQEYISILSEKVNVSVLRSIGDQAGISVALNRLEEMRVSLGQLATDRNVADPKKVINRQGFLRNSRQYGNGTVR